MAWARLVENSLRTRVRLPAVMIATSSEAARESIAPIASATAVSSREEPVSIAAMEAEVSMTTTRLLPATPIPGMARRAKARVARRRNNNWSHSKILRLNLSNGRARRSSSAKASHNIRDGTTTFLRRSLRKYSAARGSASRPRTSPNGARKLIQRPPVCGGRGGSTARSARRYGVGHRSRPPFCTPPPPPRSTREGGPGSALELQP